MAIVSSGIVHDRPLNSTDLEVAIAIGFNYRVNLIVPNVWWGLNFKHEIDVLVLTPANYAYEIEIKTSTSDLRRDFLKPHAHASTRIRRHYFCVTEKLVPLAKALIEAKAPEWGLIEVYGHQMMRIIRHPKPNKLAKPFTVEERQKLYDLASMRIWTLKQVLAEKRKGEEK